MAADPPKNVVKRSDCSCYESLEWLFGGDVMNRFMFGFAVLGAALLSACETASVEAPSSVDPTEPASVAEISPETPILAMTPAPTPSPASARDALSLYYATIDTSGLPRAPDGPDLPAADQTMSRILVGSCYNEEYESPVMAQIAKEEADLLLMVGDNVYGDSDRQKRYINNDPELEELIESFQEMADRPEFQAVRAAHPVMVAWDDHDFGANDAGGDFAFKDYAEIINQVYWGLDDEDVGSWPGTYYARSFGPEGQRTQIIMLDTRYFRGPLRPTDEWNAPGKQRYIPHEADTDQVMLGATQWTWLENQLQEPADLRLIVSSIQILTTDGHGFEHWNNMPAERQRLFDLIESTGAEGVVFVSGDRHTGFLYRSDDALPYPVHEITSSSINRSFRDESDEQDSAQLGAGYAKVHFGAIEIDWETRQVALNLVDETGKAVRDVSFEIPASAPG